jgi:hypothetical protein
MLGFLIFWISKILKIIFCFSFLFLLHFLRFSFSFTFSKIPDFLGCNILYAMGFNLQDQEIDGVTPRTFLVTPGSSQAIYRCSPEPKDLLFNDAAVNLSFSFRTPSISWVNYRVHVQTRPARPATINRGNENRAGPS